MCNERAYCVPGCPHPASPASTLFGKTCPSCLLGQIPGQAAQPAGETWRAGRTAPPALPPEEVTQRAGQLGSTSHLSEALQVRLGSPGRPSSLGAVSRPPPLPVPSTWGGGTSFRGKAASIGFCLTDARSEDKKNPRGRGGRPRPSPQDRGPKRRWKRDSPEGVSGGEVSLDGQVTPHLLPTPDTQAQLQTRRGGPPACGRPP